MIHLKEKNAFITGGTKGIGLGIAQALLNQGISVAITGRSATSVAQAEKELEETANRHGAKILGLVADVRDYKSMASAAKAAQEQLGAVDLVIANAGLGHFAPIHELSLEQWHETIDTNLTGVFYTLKVFSDSLMQHQGYFISISSLAGTNFFAGGSAYNASKFGVTGFTQAAMLDLRSYGVKMTTIMPGSVATYFNDHVPSDADYWKIQKEDLGQIVVQLISMHPRSLPSKIELRPTIPGGAGK
ncbi:MAG TPA: short-chain dehydrogenase [Flavobacteriaceae bacterium]|nr:short-chain dehydrogenase [Flavobacteriaceae bacterium]